MELHEAIKHAESRACDGTQCAHEHRQLAEWLRELLKLRAATEPVAIDQLTLAYTSEGRCTTFVATKHYSDGSSLVFSRHQMFPGSEGCWVVNLPNYTTPQPCPKCEWHVEEAKIAKAEINRLSAIKYKHFSGADCWIYQGDGEDHLDSLVCPVVIAPKQLLELQAKVSELEKDRTFHNHHVTPQVHADLMLIEKAKLEGTSNNSHLYPELKIQFLEAKLTRAEELIDAGREAIIHMCNTLTATSTSKYDGVYVSGVLKAITEYREVK